MVRILSLIRAEAVMMKTLFMEVAGCCTFTQAPRKAGSLVIETRALNGRVPSAVEFVRVVPAACPESKAFCAAQTTALSALKNALFQSVRP